MYRRYTLLLLGALATLLATFLAIALTLEPYRGDLTRLGAYREASYGGHGPEVIFVPPAAQPGRLDAHYDVVVLGDSYSMTTDARRQALPGQFWTDHFAALIGLSTGVFDMATVTTEALLASPTMHTMPPRLFILAVAERAIRRHQATAETCAPITTRPFPPLARPAAAPTPIPAPTADHPWTALHATDTVGFIKTNLWRSLTGRDGTRVRILPLTRTDLFTSRAPASLLIYGRDTDRLAWTPADWNRIACGLATLQARIEANGTTRVLFLIAPDKTTAYAPYFPPTEYTMDVTAHLAAHPGLTLVRADLALRAAIDRGIRDVYLPNDTHWGSAGARIAAEAVRAHIGGARE